jgi:hypothetical protein
MNWFSMMHTRLTYSRHLQLFLSFLLDSILSKKLLLMTPISGVSVALPLKSSGLSSLSFRFPKTSKTCFLREPISILRSESLWSKQVSIVLSSRMLKWMKTFWKTICLNFTNRWISKSKQVLNTNWAKNLFLRTKMNLRCSKTLNSSTKQDKSLGRLLKIFLNNCSSSLAASLTERLSLRSASESKTHASLRTRRAAVQLKLKSASFVALSCRARATRSVALQTRNDL